MASEERGSQNLLDEISRSEARLAELNDERARVSRRISELKAQLSSLPVTEERRRPAPSTSAQKVALFMELFRGRTDVYPQRWVNTKKGTEGYSPACSNEWVRGVCDKPRVKCGECPNQAFIPMTEKTIHDHFQGRHVIGVYPMLEDDTCWFLAVDFDKGHWQDDVTAFVAVCRSKGVPLAVERSRSADGAHVWFFFSAPVTTSTARKMGSFLITETMAKRHELPMTSYDRFFPNQDTMPRGGFGNLIALPFQDGPRQQGNSVFVDETWTPFPDQWAFLASVRRMLPAEVETFAREATEKGQVIGVLKGELEDDEDSATPWTRPPSRSRPKPVITGPLPARVRAVLSQLLFVETAGLPSALINQIKRLAAFQNPEFYKKQAMRLPIALTPRVISCAEDHPQHVGLPRGCVDGLKELLSNLDVAMIQSLARKDVVNDIVATYGHVIVDECHHVPAVSFERVMREVKARYVTGLTATPRRRDGHDPILQLQLGPVRFSIDSKSQAAARPFDHKLIVRETEFRLSGEAADAGIQEIYRQLAQDERRNRLILDDVVLALEERRSPILLTERRDHVEYFARQLHSLARNLIILQGGMKTKERRVAIEQLRTIPETEERLVLATGRFIGEGFDDARLDTLFLAMPVSWKGTLVQYAGRLHRKHQGKAEVRMMDYVDRKVPMLARMFDKRMRGYRAMGYSVADHEAPEYVEEDYILEYDQEVLRELEGEDFS